MAKFLVLYKSGVSASERMANSSPEQMKAGMEAWMKWKDALDSSVQFDWGMPVQIAAGIGAAGVEAGTSPVSGYSMMEGDKDAVVAALKTHPHLHEPGNSIDLLEQLSMPGL